MSESTTEKGLNIRNSSDIMHSIQRVRRCVAGGDMETTRKVLDIFISPPEDDLLGKMSTPAHKIAVTIPMLNSGPHEERQKIIVGYQKVLEEMLLEIPDDEINKPRKQACEEMQAHLLSASEQSLR